MEYKKKGFVQQSIQSLILLVVGLSVVTLVAIVSSTTSAKVYSNFEDDITAITSAEIEQDVNDAIVGGFQAMSDTMDFTPTVALVVMVALIMAIFIGVLYGGIARGTMGGGTAL